MFENKVIGRPRPYQLAIMAIQRNSMNTFMDTLVDFHGELHARVPNLRQDMRVAPARLGDFPPKETGFGARSPLLRLAIRFPSGHRGFVGRYHFVRRTVLAHGAGVNPHHAVA